MREKIEWILMIAGLLAMGGAAGGYQNDAITAEDFVLQFIVGLMIMIAGYLMGGGKEEWED